MRDCRAITTNVTRLNRPPGKEQDASGGKRESKNQQQDKNTTSAPEDSLYSRLQDLAFLLLYLLGVGFFLKFIWHGLNLFWGEKVKRKE
jgi:hypothetical protein